MPLSGAGVLALDSPPAAALLPSDALIAAAAARAASAASGIEPVVSHRELREVMPPSTRATRPECASCIAARPSARPIRSSDFCPISTAPCVRPRQIFHYCSIARGVARLTRPRSPCLMSAAAVEGPSRSVSVTTAHSSEMQQVSALCTSRTFPSRACVPDRAGCAASAGAYTWAATPWGRIRYFSAAGQRRSCPAF